MKAMILQKPRTPLVPGDIPLPFPNMGQVRIRVSVCGLCRTDLHVVDGELEHPSLPLVPGHQIVGIIDECGPNARSFSVGDRIGVPWLGGCCNSCDYCLSGSENLCEHAIYTGYQVNGGFAEYCVADERFCFPIPDGYPDLQASPLLCAGLIGYRAYRMTGDAKRIGLYGFGAAAHILIQVALYEGRTVYAFTREGDDKSMEFARSLGAAWSGSSNELPPEPLDAAIIFAPVGELVPRALKAVRRGGTVVCAGIYMSDIPSFPYADLWQERVLRSVANLTRRDGHEFLQLAPKASVRTTVHPYRLEDANQALDDLRNGSFEGSAVIVVNDERQ